MTNSPLPDFAVMFINNHSGYFDLIKINLVIF